MEVGFKTDKGIRRSNNEDAFFVMKKDRVFIVADGVGGNRSGEIASRTTVNGMASFVEEHPVEALKTEDEIREYFLDCISDANRRVRDVARWHKRNRGMATTVVAAFVPYNRDNAIYIVNVGDSRAYILRDDNLEQITEDHTYVNTLVKAGISASQQTYSNVNECFAALVGGEVDCVACDAAAGSYLARAFEGVEFVGTIDAVDECDIVADADALELIDKVSEALGDIASNGTLDAVHAAWYGSVPRDLANTLVDGVTLMVEEPRTESSLDDEGDEDELGTSEDGLTDESNEALADEPTDDLDADTLADDQEEDLDSESASSSTDTYQADDSEL